MVVATIAVVLVIVIVTVTRLVYEPILAVFIAYLRLLLDGFVDDAVDTPVILAGFLLLLLAPRLLLLVPPGGCYEGDLVSFCACDSVNVARMLGTYR